ncbi:Uncharacterised protein [Vibrio cholerae]|nr:Uncharacterised protein [Vibrio cholerae]CSI49901.1 Uncharacterised protein [Vibrio cholerae]
MRDDEIAAHNVELSARHWRIVEAHRKTRSDRVL